MYPPTPTKKELMRFCPKWRKTTKYDFSIFYTKKVCTSHLKCDTLTKGWNQHR